MKRSVTKTILLSAGMLFAAQAVNATNMKWLEYAPTSKFTQEDWDIAKATAKKALNEGKDGEDFSWSNAKSGNSGTITPVKDTSGESGCRDLKIHNTAGTLSGSAQYTFCKQADGSWKTTQAKM